MSCRTASTISFGWFSCKFDLSSLFFCCWKLQQGIINHGQCLSLLPTWRTDSNVPVAPVPQTGMPSACVSMGSVQPVSLWVKMEGRAFFTPPKKLCCGSWAQHGHVGWCVYVGELH